MKFADFIKNHEKEITNEWVKFAEDNISCVNELQPEKVRDHIKQMLDTIVIHMDASQSDTDQESKAANQHGSQRADVGFGIIELSSEFRALRANILKLYEEKSKAKNMETDFQEMIRFNEAIDKLWMISIKRFQLQVDERKNWFMGVLGHDLRNPLTAISGVQSILKLSKNITETERSLLGRSTSSVKRMTELIDNLLELTNLRLGSGMRINKSIVDLSKQSEKIVQELQLGYPEAEIILESPGPVEGNWDGIRLDQLMTNLIANALRHGEPGGPVTVSISAKGNEARFKVHNYGPPITENIKEMISNGVFSKNKGNPAKKDSYGLGLYIIKHIVDGHKGEIKLESNETEGTTFKIILPRHS